MGKGSEDRIEALFNGQQDKGMGPMGKMRLFLSFPDSLEYQPHGGRVRLIWAYDRGS